MPVLAADQESRAREPAKKLSPETTKPPSVGALEGFDRQLGHVQRVTTEKSEGLQGLTHDSSHHSERVKRFRAFFKERGVMTHIQLLEMARAGLSIEHAAVLMFLNASADRLDGELPMCGLSVHEMSVALGLSKHQVNRAVKALTAADAIVRRQTVKAKGVPAVTVLTDKAKYWLSGKAGQGRGVIPADLPKVLRELLVLESEAFVQKVVKAWQEHEVLDPHLVNESRMGEGSFERINAQLRIQLLNATESLAEAVAQEDQARALADQGLVPIECDDGTVTFDCGALKEHKGAIAGVDMLFVRDVLQRVRRSMPGWVTTKRVPELVAEIGYSRTVGFVSRHDAEGAMKALVATMRRGTWSRPRGIRPTFYTAADKAMRFSTGVRNSLH